MKRPNSVMLVAGGVLSGWGFGSGNNGLWISGIIAFILAYVIGEQ